MTGPLCLLWVSLAQAAITVTPAPVPEVESTVAVTRTDDEVLSGATVRATLHPDTPQARDLGVGVTDARGRLRWTPPEPGRYRLTAGKQTVDVLVAWPAPPTGSVVVLALLMLAGLGSVVHGLTRPR